MSPTQKYCCVGISFVLARQGRVGQQCRHLAVGPPAKFMGTNWNSTCISMLHFPMQYAYCNRIYCLYHIIWYLASNHKIKELCSESGKMSLLLEDLKSLFYYFERPVSTKQHISLSSRSRSNLLVDREARYVLIVYCSYVELGSSMEIKLSKACS